MVKRKDFLIYFFFYPALCNYVQRYSKSYFVRFIVIIFFGFSIYYLGQGFFESIVIFLVIEFYVVDLYTKREMSPAYMFQTKRICEADRNDISVKKLFLVVNGGVVIFLMCILFIY